MKIFVTYITIFFVLIINISYAEDIIISNIEISGSERIEKDTVLLYSGLNLGESYSNEKGNDVLKKLFETDLFSDVTINFVDGLLLINVVENPTINLIKFTGNKKKNDEDLLTEISLRERSVYSRSKIKNDVNKILSLYQRSGRLSTEVNPKVESLDDNRVNLIFEISESDIVTVSKITFIGNKIFSSQELRKVMKTKSSSLLRFFSSSDNYDPDKLDYDKILITRLYNNSGFPNFTFKSAIAQLVPNRNSFEIILTVNEGSEYEYGNINFESKLKKVNIDFLQSSLPLQKGSLYNAKQIKDSINSIKDNAATYGYNFIKVNADETYNEKTKTVDITFNINEGPKVYVNKIDISGNTVTIDKVIRRQILITEGDSYSKFLIDSSKNKIRALGYFSDVTLTETKDESYDKVNLIYDVEERNTGEATVGAGYSSSTKASIQFGLKEENFLGKGQQLKFKANFGDEYTNYDISFAEPYLFNRDLYIKTDLYNDYQDPESVNYETEKLGIGLSLGFPLSYTRRIVTRYAMFSDETRIDSNATAYEKLLSGTTRVSSLGYTFSSDKRNSPYKPSKGYKYELVQDIAGLGGDAKFVKSIYSIDFYSKLNSSTIGSVKFSTGHLNGYNDKYAPISSFYNLGGSKLRGFQSHRVGPKSGNSYTGGQYFYLLSTETNIDLPVENFDITSTLFVDFGSIWGLDERFGSIDDKHNMRASAGINFIWDSAIGPINFIFAEILKKQKTDSIDKFYFDIGYNF